MADPDRVHSLNEAIRAHGSTGIPPEEVIRAAEVYLKYLKGEKPAKTNKKTRTRKK